MYLDLLGEQFRDKERLSTPMRQEVERCRMAYEKAMEGKTVSLICSGDAGVYGLASLMYELSRNTLAASWSSSRGSRRRTAAQPSWEHR